MKYKNLNIAFLIEILVGFGTIISISLLGQKGLVALVILVLRPLVLQREKIEDTNSYLKFNYKVLSSSLAIIFIMMISIIVIIQFIPAWQMKLPPIDRLFILLIPFFLLTHGVIGFINLSLLDKSE